MGKVWWTLFSDPKMTLLTLNSAVFGLISPQVTLKLHTLPPNIVSKNLFVGHQGLLDARQEIFKKLINPVELAALNVSKFVILFSDDSEVYMSLPLEREEIIEGIVERFFHLKFDANGLLTEVNIAFPHVIRPWDLASQGMVNVPGVHPTEMLQG